MRRLVALAIFLPTFGVLVTAAMLTPSKTGEGTHQQLGLAPCGLKARTGVPCPSCGMTTAFAHATHGQLGQAFITQPTGAILAIGCAMTAIVAFYVLITAARIEKYLVQLWHPAWVWLILALFAAGWAYRLITDYGDYT